MKKPYKCIYTPRVKKPSLVVGWNKDAGKVAPTVINFLNEKLGSRMFCEIELEDFFSFGGVSVEDDIVQFLRTRLMNAIDKYTPYNIKGN